MRKEFWTRVILAFFAIVLSSTTEAAVLYGRMTGTVTDYSVNSDAAPSDFTQWYFGDNRSLIGLKVEFDFTVSDELQNNGERPVPVVNNSSDPLHFGTYQSVLGRSSYVGNLFNNELKLTGGGPPSEKESRGFRFTTQTLVNDLAPGDQFAWLARDSFDLANGAFSSIGFILATTQNILNSGDSFQSFIWTRAADPSALAAGTLITNPLLLDEPGPTFNFQVDRLTLTSSPVPLPGSLWLLGSAAGILMGFFGVTGPARMQSGGIRGDPRLTFTGIRARRYSKYTLSI